MKNNFLQHEINFIFEVDVSSAMKVGAKEKHIEFVSIDKKELIQHKVLPDNLKEGLLEWLADRKPFLKEI